MKLTGVGKGFQIWNQYYGKFQRYNVIIYLYSVLASSLGCNKADCVNLMYIEAKFDEYEYRIDWKKIIKLWSVKLKLTIQSLNTYNIKYTVSVNLPMV